MSDIAIRVEHLSKQYQIGVFRQNYDTLRDQLAASLRKWSRRNGWAKPRQETIWALQEVSFAVKQGEVLGIIGRNGAGKSTLLKILSRITEPTGGRVEIYGRVASLLEIGTGFHSELTGRENVYLNGAVLGMTKAEITRKFDEIVAFSGVEKFVDTPVKRYSSGMKVRLAFSVAAHLEPEILIIDEVLAVGDLAFQKKCLGKMEEVAQQGRTVLFVSHNMGAVTNLCTAGMWLDEGKMVTHGDVTFTVDSYLKSSTTLSPSDAKHWRRHGTGEARITQAHLLDSDGNMCTTFRMGETITVEFDVEFYQYFPTIDLSLEIMRTEMGLYVLHLTNEDCGFLIEKVHKGKRGFRVEILNCSLYPASYKITLCVWNRGTVYDKVINILDFYMVQSNISKRTTSLSAHRSAIFYMPSKWHEIN